MPLSYIIQPAVIGHPLGRYGSIVSIEYHACAHTYTHFQAYIYLWFLIYFRSDTAMVVSVTAGIHAGAWLNYCTGALRVSQFLPPFHIVWPTYSMLGRLIVRTILGFSGVVATKTFCKSLCYIIICTILQINWKELMKCQDYDGNQNKVFVDLVYKYVSCFMIGVNTVYLLPQIFSMIGIERPAFYTEI